MNIQLLNFVLISHKCPIDSKSIADINNFLDNQDNIQLCFEI